MRLLGIPAACLLILPALPAFGAASEPLQLQQVVALVEAGVGDSIVMKQAVAAGLGFEMDVEAVLALKHAGASDDLIEALMEVGPPDREAGFEGREGYGGEAGPSFRIYRETAKDGQEVIHITNLDASGRRMGGPPRGGGKEARVNSYESREEGAYPEAAAGPVTQRASPIDGPPVIVNIFNPASEPVLVREPEVHPARYPGGYLPLGGRYYHSCYGCPLPSPPGSWSHYRMYHAEGRSAAVLGHPRPGYARPVPFHTAGAYSLNALRARVRLGH